MDTIKNQLYFFVVFQPRNIKQIISNMTFAISKKTDGVHPNNFCITIDTPLKPDTTKSFGVKNKLKHNA